MKLLRRLHLYLGVLYAPLLLFYLATGWYQLAVPDRLKTPSEAESFWQKMRVVHTDQIYPTDRAGVRGSSPKWFRWLSQGLSVALGLATVIGLVLAFRIVRPSWLAWMVLLLGLLLPGAALWLGSGP